MVSIASDADSIAHPRRVFTADEATLREQRTSIKWRQYPADVLPLWVAEMDAPAAPSVTAALERAARTGDLGYPVPGPYLDSIAGWYRRAWGVEVDPALARVTTDVMTGMREGVRLVTEPGDPVVVTEPVYPPFHGIAKATGRRLVLAPLSPEGRLDAELLADTFAGLERGPSGRAALVLSNPHNPSGTVATAAELQAVLEVAAAHDVGVVVDEIHGPLVLPGATFTSVLSVPGGERALVAFSPGKGWNLAGAKSAALIAGDEVAHLLDGLPAEIGYTASHLAMQLHRAALDDGDAWLADVVADLDDNRSLLGDLLAEQLPGAIWTPMESTYLAWLDLRPLGLDFARILDRGKVALTDGAAFGPSGRGVVRMNIATSPEIIIEAVDRIAAIR